MRQISFILGAALCGGLATAQNCDFKDYKAIEALVRVLQTEKDVALLDRAHDSLEACTGRTFPPDVQDWGPILHPEIHPDPPQLAHQPSKPSFFGWFHSN